MSDLVAYATRHPRTLRTFRQATEALAAWMAEVDEAARDLGHNDGPFATTSPFDGTWDLHGLGPTEAVRSGKTDPPAGWRYIMTRDRLEPARGAAGVPARVWMTQHQMPDEAKVRPRLAELGLPTHVLDGNRVRMPSIEEIDGALWATCGAELPGCTWDRARLSDYYRAKESAELAGTEAAK